MRKKKKKLKSASDQPTYQIGYYDQNGNYITTTTSAAIPNQASPTILPITDVNKIECSACNKIYSRNLYIYQDNYESDFNYNGSKFTRNICPDCYCSAMDRLFGVKINKKTEDLLYKK